MKIVVPDSCKEIVNSVAGPVLGTYGVIHRFPFTYVPYDMLSAGTSSDLGTVDLSTVPIPDSAGYQKYYFRKKISEGWCRLDNPMNDLSVRLSFPTDRIPYLGM